MWGWEQFFLVEIEVAHILVTSFCHFFNWSPLTRHAAKRHWSHDSFYWVTNPTRPDQTRPVTEIVFVSHLWWDSVHFHSGATKTTFHPGFHLPPKEMVSSAIKYLKNAGFFASLTRHKRTLRDTHSHTHTHTHTHSRRCCNSFWVTNVSQWRVSSSVIT